MIWVGFIFVLGESAFFFQFYACTVVVVYTYYMVSGMFKVG